MSENLKSEQDPSLTRILQEYDRRLRDLESQIVKKFNSSNFPTVLADNFDAWDTYTPTNGSFTVGNGTLAGRYKQIGKLVFFECSLILGSTSSVSAGALNFGSLPLANKSGALAAFKALLYDVSATTAYSGASGINRATSATTISTISGSAGGFTNTSPFTWATGDMIMISGVYELP